MNREIVSEELLGLERRYWQAMKDKDVATTVELTDDPCILAGAQGVSEVHPRALEPMLNNATWKLVDFELSDAMVRMLDENVAVVAYKVHEDLEVEGKPLSLEAAESSTWVRHDGQWRCAAHTESIAGDPFGRDKK